jgi:hypothetical protein
MIIITLLADIQSVIASDIVEYALGRRADGFLARASSECRHHGTVQIIAYSIGAMEGL